MSFDVEYLNIGHMAILQKDNIRNQ